MRWGVRRAVEAEKLEAGHEHMERYQEREWGKKGGREAGKEQGRSKTPRGQENKEGGAAPFRVGQAYLVFSR